MTAPLGPSLELQGAVLAAIKASPTLKTLAGNPVRVFDNVPTDTAFPYITIGPDQNVPDMVQGLDGSEIFFDVHVWSRTSTFQECKTIGAAIKACFPLDGALSLTENRNLLIERRSEQHMIDQDNVTKRGIYTFRALVEPAA